MNSNLLNTVLVILLILSLSACGIDDELIVEEPDVQTNSNDIADDESSTPVVSTSSSDSQSIPTQPVSNRPDPEALNNTDQTSIAVAPSTGLFVPNAYAPSSVPAVESPVVESPVVESPVVESPVVESPVVESPVVESPLIENTNIEELSSDEKPDGSLEGLATEYVPQKDGFLLAEGKPIPQSIHDTGAFRIDCSFSHDNYDDAIVSPGQKDAAHHHTYFGNTAADYQAINDPDKIDDKYHLKNIGKSTCFGGTVNRSAYWMPTLYNANDIPQIPDRIFMYYKHGSHDPEKIQPFPEGLKMIVGNAHTIEEQGSSVRWTCLGRDHTQTRRVIPFGEDACSQGEILKFSLYFPMCWDGKNLTDVDHDEDPSNDDNDASDDVHSHMRPHLSGKDGYECPASHPVPLPLLSFEFRWSVDTLSSDGWYLASDRMHGQSKQGGITAHGDYMNGWDTEILSEWVKNCINEKRSCSNDLGNGVWLLEDKSFTDNSFSKYVGRPMIYQMDHPKIISPVHSQSNVEALQNNHQEHDSIASTDQDSTLNRRSGIGTNLSALNDWSQSVPFIDVMRLARPFHLQTWENIEGVEYDQNGWPAQLHGGVAYTVMHGLDKPNNRYDGVYTVLYEGSGKLEYSGNATLISSKDGEDLVNYKSGNTFNFKIVDSDKKNPIKNIRVIMPGGICENNPTIRVTRKSECIGVEYLDFAEHHEELVFNPDFLAYISDFHSIRFMNWMHANNSPVKSWLDNNQLSAATWSSYGNSLGIPVEIMVQLANKANVNPWFTMPHMANDDYVRKFAAYVKENLSSELTPYLEYSNEVWNGSFEQYNYALEQGRKLGLDNSEHWYAASKYYARRSVEIFKIWEEVFGTSDKFTRVLASQFVSEFRTNMILEFENAYKHADALAIAAYFSTFQVDKEKINTVSDVFTHLDEQKSVWLKYLNGQAELAKRYSLDLISYEGGQHQVESNDDRLTKIFIEANRDSRMGEQYQWHLDMWKKVGGQDYLMYSSPARYSKWGSWGIKEYITQPRSEAPKYDAVLDWMEDNPKWW